MFVFFNSVSIWLALGLGLGLHTHAASKMNCPALVITCINDGMVN